MKTVIFPKAYESFEPNKEFTLSDNFADELITAKKCYDVQNPPVKEKKPADEQTENK